MRWLIIPSTVCEALLTYSVLRGAVASKFPEAEIGAFAVAHTDGVSAGIEIRTVGEDGKLLLIWQEGPPADIHLDNQKLVLIWSEPGQSTLWTLPHEELSDALERVCQLAERAWDGKPLPHHWLPKKVAEHQSIFAGDRRLKDLRLAYSLTSRGDTRVLYVGSLFYAHRQEKSIQVPPAPDSLLDAIPSSASKPSRLTPAPDTVPPVVDEHFPNHRDLIISQREGENRHLFSMPYSAWVADSSPLTAQQRRVIRHPVARPLRLHGPAGSGKTLVLILKALYTLQAAQHENRPCKVLIVLNSNPVRDTVRRAIEAIDEQGFLASTKKDLQFLDVETLHGWCIRELGLEFGPAQVIHSDPLVSKETQDAMLAEILDETIREKLPKMRSLLSADMQAHLEGPRDELVRNMRYEIAIRIKGRGLRKEREIYVNGEIRSFIGRGENRFDRYLLYDVFAEYEKGLQQQGFLDTDDVVLSMQSRLAAPLWDRQRKVEGYDYVMVDETHLFNENERRVLPYLTRGETEYVPVVMTFDEVQSIGGRRSSDLEHVGITHSERRDLSYVHRSSPDIFVLARDLVERSALVFSEFESGEGVPRMSARDLKKCHKPEIIYGSDDDDVASLAAHTTVSLRSKNYQRIAIIVFQSDLLKLISAKFSAVSSAVHLVRERGELVAAAPNPGVYLMTPENSGGLEFDAVILAGVDDGRVPASMRDLSPEGHMSVVEEAYKEIYTAITRARYRVCFVCNRHRGLSSLVKPSLDAGYTVPIKSELPQA